MIQTNIKRVYVVLFFLFIGLMGAGCEGPSGPEGPQGSQGLQGEQGQQGEQGPPGDDGQDGEDGEDGNANVIWSEWTSIDSWDLKDDPRQKGVRFPDTILPQEVIHSGVLIVYRKYNPNPSITRIEPLPLQLLNAAGEIVVHYKFNITGNGIFLNIYSFGRDITNDEYKGPVVEFRYVLIPPGTAAKMPSGFFENYEAVKDLYGIPD